MFGSSHCGRLSDRRSAPPRRRRIGRAPRPGSRPGASVVRSVPMDDPAPVRVSGPRTFVRQCPSTRLPSPSHAAAAACPATTGPPALRHAPRRAEPFGHDESPRPAQCVAPRPGSPHRYPGVARFRAMRPLLPSVVRPCPRATANMATVPFAMRRPPNAAPAARHMGVTVRDAVMQGSPALPCRAMATD